MSTYHAVILLIMLVSLPRKIVGLSDTIYVGSTYLMSAEITGDGFYLGCGDDSLCSILPISDAQEHDGWTAVDEGNSGWGFKSTIDHNWILDVESDGYNIFANSDITNTLGQIWALYPWPDGTYRISNNYWKSNLDIKDNVTPFMNTYSGDTSNLLGQRWYFRSVEPQTTVTSTTTSTIFQNVQATSTTTLTITTCLVQRDEEVRRLKKRASGSDLLSTTTQTSWVTDIVTSIETNGARVVTNTNTVISCPPNTVVSTQSGKTITSVSTASVTQSGSTSPGKTTTSVSTASATQSGTTSASRSSTASTFSSFSVSGLAWVSLFWLITTFFVLL